MPFAPDAFDYAPFYCEENALRLSAHSALGPGARFVVFVTNAARTVPMMHQRAAPEGGPVLWDYHVVVLVDDGGVSMVWDLDCVLGPKLVAADWLQATFPWPLLPEEFQPCFRLVDAKRFASAFSSDRTHMLDAQGVPRAAPPPWPRPGHGAPNLERYLSVDLDGEVDGLWLGEVLALDEFAQRVGVTSTREGRS